MAHSILARPYARAAFEHARGADALAQWSEQLALLAAVAGDDRVHDALRSPGNTPSQRAGLLRAICGDRLDEGGVNLVRVMAEKGRLELLPEVAAAFEALRAAAENRIDARVVSARALDDKQQKNLSRALKKRLGQEVRLDCSTDPDLIGGVIVRAGDMVIDGSLRGRLQRLASDLAH